MTRSMRLQFYDLHFPVIYNKINGALWAIRSVCWSVMRTRFIKLRNIWFETKFTSGNLGNLNNKTTLYYNLGYSMRKKSIKMKNKNLINCWNHRDSTRLQKNYRKILQYLRRHFCCLFLLTCALNFFIFKLYSMFLI